MTFFEKFCLGCFGVATLVGFYELGRKHGDINMIINIDESSLHKEKETDPQLEDPKVEASQKQ